MQNVLVVHIEKGRLASLATLTISHLAQEPFRSTPVRLAQQVPLQELALANALSLGPLVFLSLVQHPHLLC